MPDIDFNKDHKSNNAVENKEINSPTPGSLKEEVDAYLNKPYTDKRTVTICLVNRISFYRRANDKVMDKRNEFIGSCIRSSQTLASVKDEVNTYFPNLIGASPNNEDFITKVKEWLNNIQVKVDELGKELNITFHYNTKKDYLDIKRQEEAIEEAYIAADKSTSKNFKKAIENKITDLNALESTKYKFGRPENVADYLLYRHCLLYKDVAKDMSNINSDKSIRFYFKDNQKEEERQRKLREELNKAKRNYVALCGSPKAFENVYIQYCVLNKLAILPALAENEVIKENNLDRFSMEEPVKFNKICDDKDIAIKSNIERLVASGIFIRHPYSQNIVSAEGEPIGANMKEAVAYFKNPDNEATVDAYLNKLKFN